MILLITKHHPPLILQVCRCSLQVDILENSLQSASRISLSATTFAQRPFADQSKEDKDDKKPKVYKVVLHKPN